MSFVFACILVLLSLWDFDFPSTAVKMMRFAVVIRVFGLDAVTSPAIF